MVQALRANDRRQVEAKVFQELGINEIAFKRLPRALHQACWRGAQECVCVCVHTLKYVHACKC